ncbi:cupin domain-containing protein [Candidatus Latescibacterota bacterium]
MDAKEIIELLNLEPHPREGGYYRETYRSNQKIPVHELPSHFKKDKHVCTAIYYLLTPETFSALHRVPTDELYHFYLGDPVIMFQLYSEGKSEKRLLGNNIDAGHCPQCLVPGGVWQGMKLIVGGRFALMGTTMSPGFDFQDFELGKRSELIEQYPEYEEMIKSLTT